MNRRGFLGLLGKLVTVGAAMGVAPGLIKPAEEKLVKWFEWVQVSGPDFGLSESAAPGTLYAFKVIFAPEGAEPEWVKNMNRCIEIAKKTNRDPQHHS